MLSPQQISDLCCHFEQSVLQSSLILDEDLETLLKNVTNKIVPFKSYFTRTKWACIVGGLILGQNYTKNYVLVTSIGLTLGLYDFYVIIRFNSFKKLISQLISEMKQLNKTNKSILRYMKTHNEPSNLTDTIFDKQICLLNEVRATIFFISQTSSLQDEDLIHLNEVNLSDLPEDPLETWELLNNVTVFFFSKLLTLIAMIKLIPKNDLTKVFSRVKILIKAINLTNKISSGKFDESRFATEQLRAELASFRAPHLESRLNIALVDSITSLSVIVGKARNVLEVASRPNTTFTEQLTELRDLTRATYEQFELLCKLHGIISNKPKPSSSLTQNTKKPHEEPNIASVKFDDQTEAEELRYELLVGEADQLEPQTSSHNLLDEGAYLKLMLNELKGALAQHQRFEEAARKRRGSGGDEQETVLPGKPQEPERFKLEEPPRKMEDLQAMLADIRALSRQRDQSEDVFGDSGEESD